MSAEPSSKRAKIEDKEDIQAEQQSFNIGVWMRDSGRFHYCMVEAWLLWYLICCTAFAFVLVSQLS